MGSGKSGLYEGTYGSSRSIKSNLTPALIRDFGYHNGLFGVPGRNKGVDSTVRNIISPSPVRTAKDFYDRLTRGGSRKTSPASATGGKGEMHFAKMSDGTTVTYRRYTKSDVFPAVDISVRTSTGSGGVKTQKIHFVKGGRN